MDICMPSWRSKAQGNFVCMFTVIPTLGEMWNEHGTYLAILRHETSVPADFFSGNAQDLYSEGTWF
jgi:hypothetical protein